MKEYFIKLFEHEYWANLKVLESLINVSEKPPRSIEIFSHLIAAQRIWIDRIVGQKTELKAWELFETQIMLDLIEINNSDLKKILETSDFEQLISYQNSFGNSYVNTINEVLTHLALHSSYHRGQLVLLLKPHIDTLPVTDYIFYFR